jgi:hypothetical protein
MKHREIYKFWELETVDDKIENFKTMGRRLGQKRWYKLGSGNIPDRSITCAKLLVDIKEDDI